MNSVTAVAEWVARIKSAEDEGDLIEAYDLALHALEEHPDEIRLRYRSVLNLSRAGSLEKSAELCQLWGLSDSEDEKIAALGARVLRERAYLARGERQKGLLWDAARYYNRIFKRTRGSFSAVNAATMFLLAGDARLAESLATQALAICEEQVSRSGMSDYLAADGATAAVILGRLELAEDYLRRRESPRLGNLMGLASMRRQLRRICAAKGIGDDIVDVARPPAVIHYTGHMAASDGGGRFPASEEERVRREVDDYLDRTRVGFAFGGLACGADVVIVEALLQRGARVHVILPFSVDQYKQTSVARGGDGWLRRFDKCLSGIGQLTLITRDQVQGDSVLFAHASRLAMGLAKLRARTLDAPLEQLAIWSGDPATRAAGTAADVAVWQNDLSLHTHVIRSGGQSAASSVRRPEEPGRRAVRAMMFGDVKGFSGLSDHQMPGFVEAVMQPVGQTLERYAEIVEFCNTWGDGLFVVFKEIEGAARCALEIQERLANVPLLHFGLPGNLRMRLGVHAGPVMMLQDPVTKGQNFFGAHVSRTARIEPVTPEGEVYVTEDFAALLAFAKKSDLTMEYVGKIKAAKDYGKLRMYSLHGRGGSG